MNKVIMVRKEVEMRQIVVTLTQNDILNLGFRVVVNVILLAVILAAILGIQNRSNNGRSTLLWDSYTR